LLLLQYHEIIVNRIGGVVKVALLNDIQGHLLGLETVLSDVADETPDAVVCLGDVASGPYPRQVVDRLRAVNCLTVKGNMDAEIANPQAYHGHDPTKRLYAEIDRWCHDQLTDDDLTYLRTFPPTVTVNLSDDATLLCCHGSPRSYDDVVSATTPDEELTRLLRGYRAAMIAVGHMHMPMLRRLGDRLIVNPGSVGLPHEYLPSGEKARTPLRAEYALVEYKNNQLRLDFRQIAYSADALRQSRLASEMPHAEWLLNTWQIDPAPPPSQ
jgi:predicted phosphodiesterase